MFWRNILIRAWWGYQILEIFIEDLEDVEDELTFIEHDYAQNECQVQNVLSKNVKLE